MLRHRRESRVELAPEVADRARGLRDRLLAPAVRDRAEQRDQRRRCRDDHLLVHAVLDQRRILLERSAQERLAGDEEDHELGGLVELRPVALRRQLRHVVAHLPRVLAQLRDPRLLVVAPERLEVRLPRHLRVDDDLLPARQLHDQVGAEPAVLGRDVRLRDEVDVLEHPGHLDDAAQLHLAPAAAHVRAVAQRADEVARFAPQLLLRLHQLTHLLGERRVRALARDLELLQLHVHLLERLLQRRDEVLDRLLLLAELRGRELEERLIVLAQRIGGERVEARPLVVLRALEERGPRALVPELDLERAALRAQDEPGAGGAQQQADEESGDHGPTNGREGVGRNRPGAKKMPPPTNPRVLRKRLAETIPGARGRSSTKRPQIATFWPAPPTSALSRAGSTWGMSGAAPGEPTRAGFVPVLPTKTRGVHCTLANGAPSFSPCCGMPVNSGSTSVAPGRPLAAEPVVCVTFGVPEPPPVSAIAAPMIAAATRTTAAPIAITRGFAWRAVGVPFERTGGGACAARRRCSLLFLPLGIGGKRSGLAGSACRCKS